MNITSIEYLIYIVFNFFFFQKHGILKKSTQFFKYLSLIHLPYLSSTWHLKMWNLIRTDFFLSPVFSSTIYRNRNRSSLIVTYPNRFLRFVESVMLLYRLQTKIIIIWSYTRWICNNNNFEHILGPWGGSNISTENTQPRL